MAKRIKLQNEKIEAKAKGKNVLVATSLVIGALGATVGGVSIANDYKHNKADLTPGIVENSPQYKKGYEAGAESRNQEIKQLNEDINALKIEKSEMESARANDQVKLQEKQTQIDSLTTAKTQLEKKVEELSTDKTANAEKINKLNNEIKQREDSISSLTNEKTQLENQIAEKDRVIEELNNRIIENANLQQNIQDGVISVLTFALKKPDIEGITILERRLVETGTVINNFPEIEETDTYAPTGEWESSDGFVFNKSEGGAFIVGNSCYVYPELKRKVPVRYYVDGTIYHEYTALEDSQLIVPETTPSKEGYVFNGWSTDGVTVIGDLTQLNVPNMKEGFNIYAVFNKIVTYVVTYEDENGNVLQQMNVTSGSLLQPYQPAIDAGKNPKYYLKGSDTEINIAWYPIEGDITIVVKNIDTVKFDNPVRVTYMTRDPETYRFVEVSHIVVESGTTITPISVDLEGFTFNGWRTATYDTGVVNILEDMIVSNFEVTADTVYYADFTSFNGYFVDFYVQGQGLVATQFYTRNNLEYVEPPVIEGRTFQGWTAPIDGLTPILPTTDCSTIEITKNCQYVAIYG